MWRSVKLPFENCEGKYKCCCNLNCNMPSSRCIHDWRRCNNVWHCIPNLTTYKLSKMSMSRTGQVPFTSCGSLMHLINTDEQSILQLVLLLQKAAMNHMTVRKKRMTNRMIWSIIWMLARHRALQMPSPTFYRHGTMPFCRYLRKNADKRLLCLDQILPHK